MIAVDTNLLVYCHRSDSDWHEAADRCIANLAEGQAPWAIPWPCIHEFLAIVTNSRIYQPATPLQHALEQVECWLESPSLQLLSETGNYWQVLRKMTEAAKSTGGSIHDARVAALCVHHEAKELWTADRDFLRFPGLRVANPLSK